MLKKVFYFDNSEKDWKENLKEFKKIKFKNKILISRLINIENYFSRKIVLAY